MDTVYFGGITISNVTFDEAIQEIKKTLMNKQKGYVVTPNASHFYFLRKDREFREAYKNANLVLADGMSLVFASRIIGHPLKQRCSGADMFRVICGLGASLKKDIFILGGTNGSDMIAKTKLMRDFKGIRINTYSPPQGFEKSDEEKKKIIGLINNSASDILFICVGSPKSEKWLHQNISRLNVSMALPFGHSLNLYAGLKQRAPKWMQNAGLEWLFRLIQEPGRLWKRYLFSNSYFVYLCFKELLRRSTKSE
jgi:N-acetylglucosaminyldiphosphoundecaprenol N-acetyl-beta-D-mannosaminyltransferase